MGIEKLLDNLIDKLEEENRLILECLKDKSCAEKLLNIVEEKEKIIKEISTYPKEDILKFEEKLVRIKHLSEENLALSMTNLQFIEDIFEAIFNDEETKTYSIEGSFSKEPKSLINKKI